MKLRNLLLVLSTIVALIFAAGLLLAPKTLLNLYGLGVGNAIANSAKINLVTQLLGAALIVPGLISWYAKDMNDAGARKSVFISLFIFDVVGFGISLLGMFSKTMLTTGWSLVIIFLVFALGYEIGRASCRERV